MKVNDNKSFFVDFYSTSVHEDSEVIKEITDIICRTGTVENRKDVGVFWWNEFQTMFTNSYSKGFETQNELERKSLEHTLEMFHASENADELSNLMFAGCQISFIGYTLKLCAYPLTKLAQHL